MGIEYQLHKLGEDTVEAHLIDFIKKLNANKSVHGIIIQMPLPVSIDYKKISQYIEPAKDVEGMHPANIGKLLFGKSKLVPCTAAAAMELINSTGVDLYGKEVVVVGHSGLTSLQAGT